MPTMIAFKARRHDVGSSVLAAVFPSDEVLSGRLHHGPAAIEAQSALITAGSAAEELKAKRGLGAHEELQKG